MQKPSFVTFTGVDKNTDIDRLFKISSRYPVEWGFLISYDNPDNRYTGVATLTEIDRSPTRTFRFHAAAHICGKLARRVASDPERAYIPKIIGRTQLNMRDDEYDWDLMKRFVAAKGKLIRQTRNIEEWPLTPLNVAPLLDCSGGRGTMIDQWPMRPPARLLGYAGGLNPENVASFLERLPGHPYTFWVDMETGVRTDDWFDLDKCEAVCKAIWG